MAELMDTLNRLLEQQTGQISTRIGADETKTRGALHAAVPALLAAFSQEAERGGGIRQAIERDHDGSIIDQLSGYLGGGANLSPRTTNGAGILDHVLGNRQSDMQQALSDKTGLDPATPDIAGCTAITVQNVMISGEPLDPARTYMVTANNFLADGGDNFTTFADSPGPRIDGGNDLEAFMNFLGTFSPVSPPSTDRVIEF